MKTEKGEYTMPDLLPLKDTTVEPLHKGHLGDRKKWPLWPGRGVI